jgi:hypothetical protein
VLISPSPLIFVESQQYEIKTVDRFKAKVEVDNDGCHLWTGCLDKNGYGFFNMGRPKRLRRAHRISYLLFVGPVPAGYDVEHRCHTDDETCDGTDCKRRRCVNPEHLEALTHSDNVLRGRSFSAREAQQTHCLRNHPLSGPGSDVYLMPRGGRQCRYCKRMSFEEKAAFDLQLSNVRPYVEGGDPR